MTDNTIKLSNNQLEILRASLTDSIAYASGEEFYYGAHGDASKVRAIRKLRREMTELLTLLKELR